ncbi:MAG: hypothetical protein K6G45_11330 [Lachnospiraceae bacterium]|nr:hypothetical protein [Lachnospiraceae bacterium]
MKNMEFIIETLNRMTESERAKYIFNQLTFDEICELYDSYGYATVIGNRAVEASYVERAEVSDVRSSINKMDRIRALISAMSPSERRDYINDVLSTEEAYILHDVYGLDIELGNGRVEAVYYEDEYEEDEYYYGA